LPLFVVMPLGATAGIVLFGWGTLVHHAREDMGRGGLRRIRYRREWRRRAFLAPDSPLHRLGLCRISLLPAHGPFQRSRHGSFDV